MTPDDRCRKLCVISSKESFSVDEVFDVNLHFGEQMSNTDAAADATAAIKPGEGAVVKMTLRSLDRNRVNVALLRSLIQPL